MCGIMAVIRSKTHNIRIDKFAKLLEDNRERGRHATGWFAFNSKEDWALRKEVGYHLSIPDSPETRKAKIIMAHVRKATHGSWINPDSNHPHMVGDLVLIHNGQSPDAFVRCKELGIDVPTHNDSHAFLYVLDHAMQEGGLPIEAAILRTIECCGPGLQYAMILFDMKTDTLYYFRNISRTLHIFATKEGLILSSTGNHITDNYDSASFFGVEVGRPESVPTQTLYSINLEELVVREYDTKIPIDRNIPAPWSTQVNNVGVDSEEEDPTIDGGTISDRISQCATNIHQCHDYKPPKQLLPLELNTSNSINNLKIGYDPIGGVTHGQA